MTRITGHRGARNLWPENGLTGFHNVLALDVDAVEFDVHLTDAGELIVIHDATLDRTTEGSGPVRFLTPEARTRTNLTGSGDIVPSLAEVLEVLAPSGKDLHVEIKIDESGRPYPHIAAKVAAEVARFGAAGRSHLTSFDTGVLEDCRREAPEIARLVSVNRDWAERQGGLSAFIDRVDNLVDIVAIQHELLGAEWDLVTSKLPLSRLCVWTLNEEELIRSWLERGIGHLTSDRPDLALRLRSEISEIA